MNECESYAHWVLDPENSHKTGRLIKLAAERFLKDLTRQDIYFDEREAMVMVEFGEKHCYQWEGDWRGKPVKFEPWQKFMFMQLYGWIRRDTGVRRFNRFYMQVAKKNGKSTMCAVLALFHLYADHRVNTPKVFTAANNEDQAKICVNMAGRIIQQSEDLMDYVDDGDVKLMTYGINITEIIHREKDGFIKALSKETDDRKAKTAGGKHGINASLGLVDEFGMSPDYGASGSIESSMASRMEWLMAFLTTAGFNMGGPCFTDLRELGIKVLEGLIEMDNYLPMIFEIDPPLDEKGEKQEITIDYLIEHPEVWQQSNPNLGISVNPDFLKHQLQQAKIKRGTVEVECKTLNFNMWVDSPEVFIPAEVWNANNQGSHIEEGETCYAGLEVGPSGEITALAMLFPGDIVKVKMLFMMASEHVSKYDVYEKNKDLIKIDPGNELDNDAAIAWILEEFSKHSVHSFCFPGTHKTNSIVQGLIKSGYTGNHLSQGVQSISNPTEEWEKLLRAEQIDHFGNPILAWMNSNCMAQRKQQGIRIEKNSKVLGIYACINAVAQWKTIDADGSNMPIGIVYV